MSEDFLDDWLSLDEHEAFIEDAIKDGYFEYEGKQYKVEEIPEGHDKDCEGTMCWCASRRKKQETKRRNPRKRKTKFKEKMVERKCFSCGEFVRFNPSKPIYHLCVPKTNKFPNHFTNDYVDTRFKLKLKKLEKHLENKKVKKKTLKTIFGR